MIKLKAVLLFLLLASMGLLAYGDSRSHGVYQTSSEVLPDYLEIIYNGQSYEIIGQGIPLGSESLSPVDFQKNLDGSIRYDIDFEKSKEGVVQVIFNPDYVKKTKLIVKNGTEQYVYNLFRSKSAAAFPLQLGDGTYTVMIYENTTGNSYKKLYSESDNVALKDENIVYLASVQEINWNLQDDAIILADALVEEVVINKLQGTKNVLYDQYGKPIYKKADQYKYITEDEVIKLMYNYVITHIQYDYDKISGLNYDYIPDIDLVLEEGSGICYDYSVLLASMLRSQGIPTKLIKGYSSSTDVYHAWNEIFLTDEERWVIVDTTFDAYMYKRKLKYSFEKKLEDYSKSKEF